MAEMNIVALPGQHICFEFLKNEYYLNCDIKIYSDWCCSGPMMIVDNSHKMVKINNCPLCGVKLNTVIV